MITNQFEPILILIGCLNISAFFLVGWDKSLSVNNSRRLPEVFIFFIAVWFSAFGVLAGMFLFRHKIRKIYFLLGIAALVIQQALLLKIFFRL